MKFLRTLALLGFAAALAIAPAAYAQNKQTAPAQKDAKAAQAALIDINTATAEQLQTLDGIAEARSAAIIKNRPYTNKAQIVSKAGIPQAVYDAIKDKIVAKQPGKDKADKNKGGDKNKSNKNDKKKGQDKAKPATE